jgi:hypothetical protein
MSSTADTRGDHGAEEHLRRDSADLGRLLAAQGDAAGARMAYRRALNSGHPDTVPVAARGS